jgi:hypothetical protein
VTDRRENILFEKQPSNQTTSKLRLECELDRARAADLVQRIEAAIGPPEPRLLAKL